MNDNPKRFYDFGPFRLDEAEHRLLRDGVEVRLRQGGKEARLPKKALEVLLLLIANAGHLVRRDDLMEEVWHDTFVGDNRLSDNVSTLRKALGDTSKEPHFIETVAGLGYRFKADVREVIEQRSIVAESTSTRVFVEETDEVETEGDAGHERAAGRAAGAATFPPEAPAASRRVLTKASVLVAALVLLGGAALVVYVAANRRAARGATPGAAIKSIAVLPFRPLDEASRDEALELGMADTLITRLSAVRDLVVRPTSAVRSFTDVRADPFEIGRRLQVESVLEGHIQRVGERVRVTLRLARVEGGEALWSEQFDEKYTDIFALQDSISERVAAALGPKLSRDEAARLTTHHTDNTEAYRLYLLGRFFWNKRTPQGFERAADYYRQAVAADPGYALAHAGLAETYVLLPNWLDAPPDEAYTVAERAALRALELDPRLAEAYTALASVKIYHHRDWEGAGADYRRAIELNPNYATARQWYSEWLAMTGRLAEAVAEGALAQRLDPLSPIITFEHGVMLYFAGRLGEAEAQMRKALELDPGMHRPRIFLSRIYFDRGLIEQSIKERALLLARGDEARRGRYEATLLAAYRAGGREGYLRRQVELCALPEMHHDHRVGGRVESCARLGDKDCAFAALDEAERVRHPIVDLIKVDPYFDSLRSDPRYADLLRRMKLPL